MKYRYTVKRDGILYPAGTEVPVGIPAQIELTDNVPYGALEENPDGSVNAYDDSGNMVGNVSAEEVKQVETAAGEMLENQCNQKEKEPKQVNRGRKPKEA